MNSSNYTQQEIARFRQRANREVTIFLQRMESLDFDDDGDFFSQGANHDDCDISQQYDDYAEKKCLAEKRKKLTQAKRRELEDKLEKLDHRLAYATWMTQVLLQELDAKRRRPNGAEATEALARYRAHETERYNLSVVRDGVKSEIGELRRFTKGV